MDFQSLHEYVALNHDNICQIAAFKNGTLAYSDCWHGFAPTDALHVMSVTKSVVSLLVGTALDRGLIPDLQRPVLDYFPDYKVKRGEKTIQSVTLEHLLTMTAPYKYRSEPWTKICSSDNWTDATLDILGGKAGLTGEFRYSTLGVHIVTGILAKVTGMTTVDYANSVIFAPLGVAAHKNYTALTAEEHKEFILSKKPNRNIWFADPQGVAAAGYGLCLSALDLARIGQLCLDGGVYGGKQVVSREWLRESTRPRRKCGEEFGNMSYGLMWWTPDENKPAYAALGNGGNALYIDPARGTAVAVTSTFKPRIFDRVRFIEEYIEPMLG